MNQSSQWTIEGCAIPPIRYRPTDEDLSVGAPREKANGWGTVHLRIRIVHPQNDNLSASCTRRGLFTVEFTLPNNDPSLMSAIGAPYWG